VFGVGSYWPVLAGAVSWVSVLMAVGVCGRVIAICFQARGAGSGSCSFAGIGLELTRV